MRGSAEFYTETVPKQFNRTLKAQEQGDAETLASMRSVNATIRVVAEGSELEPPATYYLNIAEGRMTASAAQSHRPFLTLSHDSTSFEAIQKHSGGSILGFLAGLAGLDEELKLTLERVDHLAELDSAVRFRLTGDRGFTIVASFGACDVAAEPACTIQLDQATYAELSAGNLSSEDAFLSGRVVVEGDMQLAIALALATLAPD
jgi:putative sterol carrier protein